jgi:alkylation response protein AidB-like acyl-CoA dehydrogenase
MWRAPSGEIDGFPAGRETLIAKLYASEMVRRVTSDALQIHGHLGVSRRAPFER